jgi:putative serine protease PepD
LGKVVDMNEYETNPQRHETTSPEESSHRSADAPRDNSNPERGQSDSTTPLTSPAPWQASVEPATDRHAAAPAPADPTATIPTSVHPTPPQPTSAQPSSAEPTSAQPSSAQPSSAQPASPWQSGRPGQAPAPGQPYATPSPYSGQPPYPGQSPYSGQPQQPGQPQPGQHYAAGHVPYGSQPHYAAQAANGTPTAHGTWAGGVPPQSEHGTTQMPVWAQPVGTDQHEPARPGRGRKVLLTGAAALLLALSAGGVGAAVALTFDDNGSAIATTKTGSSAVTRVVDRSSLAEIASSVQDSVVSITTGSGEGSGVVLSADGYVLTNNHVVSTAQGGKVKVVFANGKSADATVIGTDPRTDLAVVKATGVTDLKPAEFGSSADMKVGDTVLALGSPLGLEGSVTAGIISAKDRTIQSSGEQQQPNPFGEQQQQAPANSMSGLLQTDAPINPGNSGGALVNTSGQVIGINSAIATSGQSSGNIGLGFAIPSDKAKDVANQLMAGKKVSHPALGVGVAEVEGGGAAITAVTVNSAAAKAGLQKGDIVKQVNGKAINDSDDLVAVIQAGKVGDQVTVVYTRDGVQKTATATLAEATS